jgi:predicted chitinase
MALPFLRKYGLASAEGGDGRQAYVNADGAFIGVGVPLLARDADGRFRPRDGVVLEALLAKGYGAPVELGWRVARLRRVAEALNKGDLALAGISLLHLDLPPLPSDEHARSMAEADDLLAKTYNADQPRAPKGDANGGQWVSQGDLDTPAGGAGAAPAKAAGPAPQAAAAHHQTGTPHAGADVDNGAGPAKAAAPAARVTADQLRAIMPHAGASADAYVDALNAAMARHGITTPAQQAAFLAQISQESGDLRHTTENLNYSAQRLAQVFPRHFPSTAVAQPYAHNPEAIANRVYGALPGNGGEASGDGYRFRGRGLIQVTGRSNYRAVGYENDPVAMSQPQGAAESAAAYWAHRNLNAMTRQPLSRSEFDRVTRRVNGGQVGANARWAAYQRALRALRPSAGQ